MADKSFVTWRFYTKKSKPNATAEENSRITAPKTAISFPVLIPKDAVFRGKPSWAKTPNSTKPRVKCANCGVNHTANFRGFVAWKTYRELDRTAASGSVTPPGRAEDCGDDMSTAFNGEMLNAFSCLRNPQPHYWSKACQVAWKPTPG